MDLWLKSPLSLYDTYFGKLIIINIVADNNRSTAVDLFSATVKEKLQENAAKVNETYKLC